MERHVSKLHFRMGEMQVNQDPTTFMSPNMPDQTWMEEDDLDVSNGSQRTAEWSALLTIMEWKQLVAYTWQIKIIMSVFDKMLVIALFAGLQGLRALQPLMVPLVYNGKGSTDTAKSGFGDDC